MKSRRHIMQQLMAALATVLLSGCSMIDDDLSDCDTDYTLDYELRLVTNMTLELQSTLTLQTDVNVATVLQSYLSNIFTDYAYDVDLSFYDTQGDSVRLYHDEHIMDANQHSYTLYIPRQKYMHLAVANIVDNAMVDMVGDGNCHTAELTTPGIRDDGADTISSHTTGLFTARYPMDIQEGIDQRFNVNLYMANCSAALVIDPQGHHTDDVKVYCTGFATSFNIADSTYRFSDRPPVVRATPIETGNQQLCFCSVNFPSPEVPATRSRIETEEPFIAKPGEQALWQLRVYVTQADGAVTESILGIREPLRPGQLKVVRCRLDDNGAVTTDDHTVAVSVTLNWNEGGQYHPEL